MSSETGSHVKKRSGLTGSRQSVPKNAMTLIKQQQQQQQ